MEENLLLTTCRTGPLVYTIRFQGYIIFYLFLLLFQPHPEMFRAQTWEYLEQILWIIGGAKNQTLVGHQYGKHPTHSTLDGRNLTTTTLLIKVWNKLIGRGN